MHGTMNAGKAHAVVQVLPGWIEDEQRAALASGLSSHGFIPWIGDAPKPGSPAPTAETFLKAAEADRNRIAEEYGPLPVILFGIGYDAFTAAALLARLPAHYIAAGFWNMPVISPARRLVLLSLLRWERFRLGSDVASRILRSVSDIPPTIGMAIAVLEFSRELSRLPRSLPIYILRHGSSTANPPALEAFAAWASGTVGSERERDHIA